MDIQSLKCLWSWPFKKRFVSHWYGLTNYSEYFRLYSEWVKNYWRFWAEKRSNKLFSLNYCKFYVAKHEKRSPIRRLAYCLVTSWQKPSNGKTWKTEANKKASTLFGHELTQCKMPVMEDRSYSAWSLIRHLLIVWMWGVKEKEFKNDAKAFGLNK